jgi:hypothetical protein
MQVTLKPALISTPISQTSPKTPARFAGSNPTDADQKAVEFHKRQPGLSSLLTSVKWLTSAPRLKFAVDAQNDLRFQHLVGIDGITASDVQIKLGEGKLISLKDPIAEQISDLKAKYVIGIYVKDDATKTKVLDTVKDLRRSLYLRSPQGRLDSFLNVKRFWAYPGKDVPENDFKGYEVHVTVGEHPFHKAAEPPKEA